MKRFRSFFIPSLSLIQSILLIMQISDGIVDQSQQIVVVGAGSGILGKGV